MKQYKIYVYAICKNEEAFVPGWVDSMKEADQIIVTDTGSQDQTVPLLRRLGAVVYEENVSPWRFDTARNLSLSHVPEDADICVCTDLDERFLPGWRKALEDVWLPGCHMGNYLYNWSLKPDGSPYVQMVYFKVHSRFDYVWDYPAHECLRYIGTGPEKKVFIPGMVLNHYPDENKSRSSYLSLLELGASERPSDPRMSYYLGREYFYRRRWRDCISELQRGLSLPSSSWAEERCGAMRWIAQSYMGLSQPGQALRWYFRAIGEVPSMRDPYVEAAFLAYTQSDWPLCLALCLEALKITQKSSCFTNAGYAWDHTPHDLAAIAAWRLDLRSLAVFHAQKAAELSPDNPRLKKNLELMLQSCS